MRDTDYKKNKKESKKKRKELKIFYLLYSCTVEHKIGIEQNIQKREIGMKIKQAKNSIMSKLKDNLLMILYSQ